MTKDRNKSILDAVMSFIDGLGEGEVYAKEKVYSKEELNQVTREGYFVFHVTLFNYLYPRNEWIN